MESPYQLGPITTSKMRRLVSILVLMESPYQHNLFATYTLDQKGFNPCFNGIALSTLSSFLIMLFPSLCFNPCFNGIALSTYEISINHLIEESFNPCFNGIALSTGAINKTIPIGWSFNPCFNGIALSTIVI